MSDFFLDPKSLQKLVEKLPRKNRDILVNLVSLIIVHCESETSKMDIESLCICIGPAISRRVC